ncbi:DUF3889 domain-containing protein [Bacillus alveayuensis]|jgi:hypothetical protein|uniref:DUF3889 domain-containing protein n=1 Tax=Aeribacillus alveayuensis TaxID=279215 RepID=UPI0005CDC861|nr:DUF3889 domain-containing protein [Bacillus alveayuensis]
MEKSFVSLLLGMMFIFGNFSTFPFTTINTVSAEREVPPYAKWGELAIEKTKEKYPNAQVIDYLHIGTETKANSTIEKFKLRLKENDKQFNVFVNIEFETVSEKVIDITFKQSAT